VSSLACKHSQMHTLTDQLAAAEAAELQLLLQPRQLSPVHRPSIMHQTNVQIAAAKAAQCSTSLSAVQCLGCPVIHTKQTQPYLDIHHTHTTLTDRLATAEAAELQLLLQPCQLRTQRGLVTAQALNRQPQLRQLLPSSSSSSSSRKQALWMLVPCSHETAARPCHGSRCSDSCYPAAAAAGSKHCGCWCHAVMRQQRGLVTAHDALPSAAAQTAADGSSKDASRVYVLVPCSYTASDGSSSSDASNVCVGAMQS
jgi:hypothetical protein